MNLSMAEEIPNAHCTHGEHHVATTYCIQYTRLHCNQFYSCIFTRNSQINLHLYDGQYDLLPIRNDWIYLTVSIVLLAVDGNNLPCVDSNQWRNEIDECFNKS